MNDKLKDILPKLLQQSPTAYKALTTPYDYTYGQFEGELPLDEMFGHDKKLIEYMDRGYDPELLTVYPSFIADNKAFDIEEMQPQVIDRLEDISNTFTPSTDFPSDDLKYAKENAFYGPSFFNHMKAYNSAKVFDNTDPSNIINRDELLDLGGDLGGRFDDLGSAMENDSDLRTLYSYLSKKKYGV